MRDRRSILATVALVMLDSDLNRRHLHHTGRMFLPGMVILHRLLTQEDQQELRQKIGLWRSAFQPLALGLATSS
jgi:hypothetical protein